MDVPTVAEAIARIRARDPIVRAFIRTRLDDAEREAAARVAEAPRSELHGVPYSLKDMWDTAGIPTTGGSDRHRDRVPRTSAPVHQVFERAGAVLLGKTNLSDMGMAAESASWVGGVTCNPCDHARTAGGSSGGSAAAVADGMAAFDWGSDFGGSIRMPAAFCGVYGMRLSTETWPVVGSFPSPPEPLHYMNGQGPLAASLPMLESTLRVAAPLRTGTERRFALRGAAVFATDGVLGGRWPAFRGDVSHALARAAGDVVVDRALPSVPRAVRVAYQTYGADFEALVGSDPLGLGGGIAAAVSAIVLRGRFGDRRLHPRSAEALASIALVRLLLAGRTRQARGESARLREDFSAVWDRGLVVAAPACVFPAPRHGWSNTNPLLWAYATPFNVADATALAIPWGHFADGLPRALQLCGPPGSEWTLIEIARRLLRTATGT